MASFARRALKPHAVTGAIGTLTVVFGIGQCIGPVLSGALADGPSGLKAGLWLSVGDLGRWRPSPPRFKASRRSRDDA